MESQRTKPDAIAATAQSVSFDDERTEDWSPKRRDFLRMLGYGGGLAALGMLPGCGGNGDGGFLPSANAQSRADELRRALTQDQAFWDQVQTRFVLNPGKRFMNIGTAGSMPREVLEKFNADNFAYAAESQSGYSNFLAQRTSIAQGTGPLAAPEKGLGVDPDELVLSSNTSDGMCHAILGIEWNRGDVVLTTNMEHGGGNTPLAIARDRYGIEIRRVTLPTGPTITEQTFVTVFSNAIDTIRREGKVVRAMMWSSPIYLTGTQLPIRPLVELAIAKSAGSSVPIITIVDGAHLPGMFALNYAALGMDFMAGAGHKWQCGPGSTGLLVVRNKVRSAANPLPLPKYWPVTSSGYPLTGTVGTGASAVPWTQRATGPTATYDIGSVITSLGSRHVPLLNGLTNACAIWDSIGRKKIETYVLTLADYLRERVSNEFGPNALYQPKTGPLSTALTLINPWGYNGGDATRITRGPSTAANPSPYARFLTAMEQRGFVLRNTTVPVLNGGPDAAGLLPATGDAPPALATTNHFPIRVSTHLWHDAADIDALIDAMKAVVPTIT